METRLLRNSLGCAVADHGHKLDRYQTHLVRPTSTETQTSGCHSLSPFRRNHPIPGPGGSMSPVKRPKAKGSEQVAITGGCHCELSSLPLVPETVMGGDPRPSVFFLVRAGNACRPSSDLRILAGCSHGGYVFQCKWPQCHYPVREGRIRSSQRGHDSDPMLCDPPQGWPLPFCRSWDFTPEETTVVVDASRLCRFSFAPRRLL